MIFQSEYLAALAIGFFGSLHCLGMCGPIALVVKPLFPGNVGRLMGGLIYNSGRILTYAMLGMLAGLLGKELRIAHLQQFISISLGALIIIYALYPYLFRKISLNGPILHMMNWIKNKLKHFIGQKGASALFAIGLVNGLLPCGLVYIGLAGSVEISGIVHGAFFMTFFGLGTLPMMTGVNMFGDELKGAVSNVRPRVIQLFVGFIGILLIIRGLGLGIPYISPSTKPHPGDHNCHLNYHRHPE